ncbi:hypothetical protein L1987_53463 [Smallanthus sonchifolius]|uniref:Uncharacterized protein n=1 Tax=Smallanthus sonchifolius TaxID=185202 RepID=A0ACB9EX58_9ASTR|nr:hypothetical protein L1987_53463 [Smallanthus sonchifolius]
MARAFTSEFNLLAHTEPEWKGVALQYRDIVDFLNRSRISYAISADPIVSRPYLEQFWETAEHDCTVTPNVIRATVAGHDIAFSEDTIRRVLQFRDLSTDPTAYPDYFVDGCWRQRMGYVGARDYASYKKMWVLDQWRYFAHVMIMCISSRKAGKDAMGHDLAAAMVGLSLNRGYNFSRYVFKAINDQINMAERFNFLLYPRFVQLLIDDTLPNLPATRERLQVKWVDKRVFAQFLNPGSVEPTPEHITLFGHLIKEAYVAPADWRWFSHDSEPELSEHSDEQQEKEEAESVDESSESGDEEAVHDVAEGSDSEATDEYEPDSDSDAATQRQRRESVNKWRGDRQQHAIPSEVEVSTQQQVQVSAASTDSASTPPSQQLYRRQRRRPHVQPDVAVTSITEEVPVIVTLPISSVLVAVNTPILTKNPGPNDARIENLETQVATLLETVRKSKEESDAQQAKINSLVDEVTILKSQRMGTEERLKNVMAHNELLIETNNMILGYRSSLELRFDLQRKEHDMMVKLIADLTKKLDAQGRKIRRKIKRRRRHLNLPHQALAIVPISSILMAEGESTHQEGGDTSSGDKGKLAANVLKDLSDDEILYLEPDYSKEAQIEALYNLEEGEINSGSAESASNVEPSTKASPADPTPVDPEAQKDKDMPASSSKDPAPI